MASAIERVFDGRLLLEFVEISARAQIAEEQETLVQIRFEHAWRV